MTGAPAAATLDLFHHWADEAGWVLAVDDGRIVLEGRVRTPALPGPSTLVVAYLDAPTTARVDGVRGALTPTESCALTCRARGDGTVHVAGTLALTWTPATGGPARTYALPIDVIASLVT